MHKADQTCMSVLGKSKCERDNTEMTYVNFLALLIQIKDYRSLK
jgi:hypothetical protein